MAEIGIERLGAGDDQKDRAERDKPDHAVAEQEARRRRAGLNAHSTVGFCPMCHSPATAIATNQTSVIGPKNAATLAVPRDCTANSADQDHDGQRHDVGLEAGVTIFKPSTADSTDSAGVMIASP